MAQAVQRHGRATEIPSPGRAAARPTGAWRAERGLAIRRGVFAFAALALLAVLATHLIGFGADHPMPALLNADSSSSWSHRAVSAILVLATASCLLGAVRFRPERGLWATAAVILAFLSIDELTTLHAQIDDATWGKALYAPILLVLGICLWWLADNTAQRPLLRVGLLTLIVSFAIHVFGVHVVHALGWTTGSWPYQVKVALKEGTELAGWLLILAVLLLTTPGSSSRRRAP
jgi:hypothetical protein